MRHIELPSASELKAHTIAYYTMLLKESKSDDQKRFLRTQLYHLKSNDHGCNISSIGSIPRVSVPGPKILSLN